jgi:hypothetical protein
LKYRYPILVTFGVALVCLLASCRSLRQRVLYVSSSLPTCENGRDVTADPIKVAAEDATVMKERLKAARPSSGWEWKVHFFGSMNILATGANDTIVVNWLPRSQECRRCPVYPEAFSVGGRYYEVSGTLEDIMRRYEAALREAPKVETGRSCQNEPTGRAWSDSPDNARVLGVKRSPWEATC